MLQALVSTYWGHLDPQSRSRHRRGEGSVDVAGEWVVEFPGDGHGAFPGVGSVSGGAEEPERLAGPTRANSMIDRPSASWFRYLRPVGLSARVAAWLSQWISVGLIA